MRGRGVGVGLGLGRALALTLAVTLALSPAQTVALALSGLRGVGASERVQLGEHAEAEHAVQPGLLRVRLGLGPGLGLGLGLGGGEFLKGDHGVQPPQRTQVEIPGRGEPG